MLSSGGPQLGRRSQCPGRGRPTYGPRPRLPSSTVDIGPTLLRDPVFRPFQWSSAQTVRMRVKKKVKAFARRAEQFSPCLRERSARRTFIRRARNRILIASVDNRRDRPTCLTPRQLRVSSPPAPGECPLHGLSHFDHRPLLLCSDQSIAREVAQGFYGMWLLCLRPFGF